MENNKYQRGKIYKIVDNTNNNIYIGSTTEPTLARRLAKHVGNYKFYKKGGHKFMTSFNILENNDYNIILIESYPCNSRDELYSRESYWTNQYDCVNKIKNQGKFLELGQSEYNKEYYKDNNEKIKENQKDYYKENIGKIKDYQKDYYKENIGKIKDYKKDYYHKNAEKFKENRKDYYNENAERIKENGNKICLCECGRTYTQAHKSSHCKSMKHIKLSAQNINMV
jgi:hypothetical protein